MHLLGDEKLAQFLRGLSRVERKKAAKTISEASGLAGLPDDTYFEQRFPKSAQIVE